MMAIADTELVFRAILAVFGEVPPERLLYQALRGLSEKGAVMDFKRQGWFARCALAGKRNSVKWSLNKYSDKTNTPHCRR